MVHDGLISFYIEKHASNYIAMMAEENNYAESPYVASRIALLAARQQTGAQDAPTSNNAANIGQSIHSSFQKSNTSSGFNQHQQHTMPSTHQHLVQQISDHNTVQLERDNRHFSDSTNSSMARLIQQQQQHLHSTSALSAAAALAKSNAIFDRFDIINSEKQHRFKSQNFKGKFFLIKTRKLYPINHYRL